MTASVLALALLLLSTGPLVGQVYNVQHYTARDGLPQVQVLTLHQDETGYLWFGTYGGLSRFNGVEIRTLTTRDGLGSNVVEAIAHDDGGRLYLGTQGGGLCMLDHPVTLRPDSTSENSDPDSGDRAIWCLDESDGLASDNVVDVLVEADGTLWAATEDGGLSRYRNGTFTTFGPDQGLPSGIIHTLALDPAGRLWVGTEEGLARREGGRFAPVRAEVLAERSVLSLLPSPAGLVVGTAGALYLLDDGELEAVPVPRSARGATFIDGARSSSGTLWIVTDRGLLRQDDEGFELLTEANGLLADAGNSILVDREGSVWTGTDRGASKLVPGPFRNYSVREGLPHRFARAVSEGPGGTLWVGTRDGVAAHEAGGFRTVLSGDDLRDPRVYALARAPEGGMLVGTRGELLHWRADGPDRTYLEDDGLPSEYVLDLLPDGEGGAWIGTSGGVARWRDGEVVPFPEDHPLTDVFVVRLEEGPEGRLWIGLRTGGVRIWDGETVTTLSREEGLTSQTVWDMAVDARNRMWVGSNGDGVFCIDGDEIIRYTTAEGLVNNFVWQLLSDSRGDVWLYTNRGLDRFRNGEFVHYGLAHGLVNLEGSAGAALEQEDGTLWFGSASGLLHYRPGAEQPNTTEPPVVIEGVSVGEEPLLRGGEVPPDANILRIRFAALSFRDVPSIRYRYRLLGPGDDRDDWSAPVSDRAVSFAGLGPGDHTFQVVAINEDGLSSRTPASFSFTVLPAFWQTWWFWTLGVLTLVSASWSIPFLRARRLAAERERLEARVEEHTQELQEANVRLREEIAERERFEEALKMSETRLREIVENSTNVFYSHGPDHQLTYFSPQVEDLLGIPPEEALTDWTEFLTDEPANRAGYDATVRAIETGERQPPYELQLRHADGHPVWVRVTEAPVVRNGETVAVVGSLTDITEARRAERERQRLEEQLRHSQKMEAVGRLAGGVAHDFNNLLTSILGHVDLVMAELTDGEEELREDLDEVKKAGEQAAGLVEQLLAFSRKQVVKPEVVEVNEVVADNTKMLRRVLGEDVALVTELDEPSPKTRIDRNQLEQILVNLSVNARDAMPRGGRLTVATSSDRLTETPEIGHLDADFRPGPYAVVRVSDTGEGMDAETLERVFEPFFTTKEVGKGSGLGLATVYGIVKQNDGFVWAESEPGEGTTFVVCLPATDGPAPPTPDREPGLPFGEAGAQEEEEERTVLVVEDEEGVRKLVSRVLERKGYRVLEASKGRDALDLAGRYDGPIDLLLTDMIMPGMTGKALAEAVTASRRETRVLFISGYTDDVLGAKGVVTPEVDLLQKPFDPRTLVERVEDVLEG